jgi:signal peptidase II
VDAVADPGPDVAPRAGSARRTATVFALVATVWVALDQATKLLAVRVFDDNPVDLGWIRLVDVRNENAAFGIPGFPGLFLIVTVVVLTLVIRSLPRTDSVAVAAVYGLIVGGALGNAVDRVFRAPGFPAGAVVDFLDLGWWPVFNVADIGITCGAALLVVLLWRAERREPAGERSR